MTTAYRWIPTGCPAAIVNEPPVTSCENSLGVVSPQVSIIHFLIAHLLCCRLSLHLPALQTGAAAMFPGLGAASMSAAQGKTERGAAGEAGAQSDWGSAWFLLLSTVKPLGETVTAGDRLHIHTDHTHTSVTLERTQPNTKAQFSYLFNINKWMDLIQTQLDPF